MSEEIGKEFWKLINRIWEREGISEDWNKDMISAIYSLDQKY